MYGSTRCASLDRLHLVALLPIANTCARGYARILMMQAGAVRVLLSKNDAWSTDGRLLKLGTVKITLSPTFLPGRAFRTVCTLA
jgi:hypothetical protein